MKNVVKGKTAQIRVKLCDSRTTVIELSPNTYFSCFSICIRTVLYLPGARQTLVKRHFWSFALGTIVKSCIGCAPGKSGMKELELWVEWVVKFLDI